MSYGHWGQERSGAGARDPGPQLVLLGPENTRRLGFRVAGQPHTPNDRKTWHDHEIQ